jgi:hypothetical protein
VRERERLLVGVHKVPTVGSNQRYRSGNSPCLVVDGGEAVKDIDVGRILRRRSLGIVALLVDSAPVYSLNMGGLGPATG